MSGTGSNECGDAPVYPVIPSECEESTPSTGRLDTDKAGSVRGRSLTEPALSLSAALETGSAEVFAMTE